MLRAAWQAEMVERAAASDMAADKRAGGRPVITLDDAGNIVQKQPDGAVERLQAHP